MQALIPIVLLVHFTNSEYIPPGPRYPCPKETDSQLLHPCVCEKGTDEGLFMRCENTGLATLSVGLGNLAGLGLPVERLILKECFFSHLFGPLLHRSTIRTMHIIDTPIKTIDQFAFSGVNRTLQELHLVNTRIEEFPKQAFKILGNLTILWINGHVMNILDKDIFAGSEAAGRLERLHIVNGAIAQVPIEAFQNLKKLKTLDLHGNRISSLQRNQFRGLRDVEVLDISHNNITKLDGSHIGDLVKLGWCNVSHNQIADIPRAMFARNSLLKVLHLDNNKIKKLDVNSFKGMRLLRRLYLQDNKISDVGRGTFSSMARIGTIDMARNLVTKIDFQMFQGVKYAEILNLAENKIKIIENQAFSDLYQAVVNISHNELETIESNAFINCNNMTLLDLSHNKLKNMKKHAFDENTYAGEFVLSYNLFEEFTQIPIQNMTGIRILNASHNFLTNIPKMAFPKLYELHTVDLSYNNISDIGHAVFQNLFSLRYINLSYNSLEIIKPATFGTIPTVLELDISHNGIREMSRGALAKLASCRVIDASHNELEKLFQIPISLGELNFAYNKLSEIGSNTWPTMNALLRLNLSNNNLEDRLDSGSFSSLLTLQSLDLSSNGVTSPPWGALNTLSSLQYLYMQNNNLTSLSKSSFGNLPTLFKLDLSYNQISTVAKLAFNGLQQLLDLSLSSNELEVVPNEAFKSLVALRKLDLSHNSLEKIDNKTNGLLDDCLSLESVNLSHNKFGFLTPKMFPSSPWIPYRLFEVDLSHNEIPVLTFDIVVGGRKFKKLNLAGNVLSDIRNNVLGNLTSLEVLDLSNNNLRDLISKTSDLKFNLPENLTHLFVQDNILETLPVPNLMKAAHLRILDVRNNKLTEFQPELVKKIQENGLEVLFEGNKLHCTCFLRPLKHYLNHLSPTSLINTKYNLTCSEPDTLAGETLLTLDEERLLCVKNVDFDEEVKKYSEEYLFEAEPDLSFRDIQYSQQTIFVAWYVKSTKDVADFYIYIRNEKNTLLYTNDVSYNLRSLSITIDKDMQSSFQNGGKFDICIQAKTSSGLPRRWHKSQCRVLDWNFNSWPKKLSVDKRRLTKKRVYSWFGSNSVLALVSDSILITLCIFLGVCFRKLADFDI